MRLFINFWLLLCSLFWFKFAIAITPADRVITLSPSATEMAYAAGMGDNIVGVSAYSDYPEDAKNIEQVANWQGINIERILLLKPDLVIAWQGGNPQRSLDQLKALGISIIYSDPQSIEEIADDLVTLSNYSHHPDIALKNAQQLRQQYRALQQKYVSNISNHPKKKVFIQFGMQPLFTTSARTLQSHITALCGGENIFANSPVTWPQVSREQVLTKRPDLIIFSGKAEQIPTVQTFWQPQLTVPVIAIDEDSFSRSSPRIINAAQQICEAIANNE
ncbi:MULTISPECIES: vitamin B12 ABC transporter substrate-binding protein BtuF [Proteus]|uniref:Vitamin B12-binding protein n=2 Tax=Proteus TaxID=583 RepID=A0A6I7D1Z0_9GAMM|nr:MULTISPECIES: vitamin B12 ABC transporter substrate-binding protein BtuF [Proteus]MBG2801507.1 vitamin B12 ABC transporter substrate-binding protein BtuF [Proteus mirabilis]MBG3018346.1 vitamin B12 ABC transporter substrate-binding protein BtuF [Proteus mirabilis]MBG3150925.1 vitamin B12 ABC transporter substrate-binding protein BtuF [Proteus mirabilis]QHN09679.1 vitamin B12 ABC transporter substrate-binding protein BtuF [Proteus columbae]